MDASASTLSGEEPAGLSRTFVNVGMLGHVDSGKTSICKAISTIGSTAAFDSNPQSVERGITIDLGFSSFLLGERWHVTLVDCPGHASLIRTVLGGVRIMDLMVLVLDVTKGMQPQSWECLILAGLLCPNVIVALNKVDLLEEGVRAGKIEKIKSKMQETLKKMGIDCDVVVPVSAAKGKEGTEELLSAMNKRLEGLSLKRDPSSPFLLAFDHCFNLKGAGAVCTGTVLQGKVAVGDQVELPARQEVRKVRSMQVFKKPVTSAQAGERVALSITGLDPKGLERGILCAPGLVTGASTAAVADVRRIPYFQGEISSGKVYHISIGYSTVTGVVSFVIPEKKEQVPTSFNTKNHYILLDKLEEVTGTVFALIEFHKPVFILPHTTIIASNLQQPEATAKCRLAFHGNVVDSCEDKMPKQSYFPNLSVFHYKKKVGAVDRVQSESVIIAKGLCTKQSDVSHLIGLKLRVVNDKEESFLEEEGAITGKIESRFGQTDKLRVAMDRPLPEAQVKFIKTNPCKVLIIIKDYKFRPKDAGKRRIEQ